jgi:4-amino-4-deoxy-L-arabinose transferase-like glycosyltransferase
MAEAWAWGKEFELGYAKHPPLFAWVTGLWFSVLPRENWSFFLLSSVNGALGLAGAWMIAGRLLPRSSQWAALLLLCLTPFYGLLALKFNANAVLLALWPWAGYFFIRAAQTGSVRDGALFGLFAALALLGKYYSLLLLASCFLSAILHPNLRALFRSPAPYAALAVGALALAPHAYWVVQHGSPTVAYALSKTRYPVGAVLERGTVALSQVIIYHLPAAGVLALACFGYRRHLAWRLWTNARARRNWWLLTLALGPLALTLLACVGGNVRISEQFMIPIFFLIPTIVLRFAGIPMAAARLKVLQAAAASTAVLVAVSAVPFGALARVFATESWREPTREVAVDATRLWHQAFGQRLDIVSGEGAYAYAAAFYSADAPSVLIGFDARLSPWITPERLARSGMLVICRAESAGCLTRAAAFASPGALHVERDYKAQTGRIRRFALILIPPRNPSRRPDLDD